MSAPQKAMNKRRNFLNRLTVLPIAGILLAAFLVIYGPSHCRAPRVTSAGFEKDVWVYLQESSPNGPGDRSLDFYLGRPGKLVAPPAAGKCRVKFDLQSSERKLFSNEDEKKKNMVEIEAPESWLKRCPAGQEGVDSGFEGVIRVWNGTPATDLDKQTLHEAKLNDKITVEMKNFDRWLFVQLDLGRFREDINDLPPDFRKYVEKAVAARRSVQFFAALNHVNQLLRSELKNDGLREQAWKTLKRMITEDPVLAELVQGGAEAGENAKQPASGPVPDGGWGDKFSDKEVLKIEQRIGPLKAWFINFTQKRFQQLTLTINGVVLRGLTPRNVFNDAEILRARRPSFRDDTYQWVQFTLERRTASGLSEEAKAEDAANAAAWARLLGRPKLRDLVKVTLTLPEAGLELPTKVTPDAKIAESQFQFIGIREEVLYATSVMFVFLLGFLGWLARTTDILRDSSGPIRPDGIEPLCLAKTQMAFWFILIAGAFAFLWVTTGNIDTINKTCLVLLGIGAGTALGAALLPPAGTEGPARRNYLVATSLHHTREEIAGEIRSAIVQRLRQLWPQIPATDATLREAMLAVLRITASEKQFAALAAELQLPSTCVPELPGSPGAVQETLTHLVSELRKAAPGADAQPLLDELGLLAKQMKDFAAMAPTAWKRLFCDLLNENPAGSSYEFFRFQMLGWTVLLGLVFVVKLLNDRAMPEFGDSTLILLGISGGTYLGFKVPAMKRAGDGEEK